MEYHTFLMIWFIISAANFLVPKLFLLSLCLLIIKWCFKWILHPLWPDGYTPFSILKVKNYFLHWSCIITYLVIFLVLFFLLRVSRIGNTFDAKPLINFFYSLLQDREYLTLIVLLSLILCISLFFVGLLTRIKDRLELELLRRHLIFFVKSNTYKIRYNSFILTLCSPDMREELVDPENKTQSKGFYFLLLKIRFRYLSLHNFFHILVTPIKFIRVICEEFGYIKITSLLDLFTATMGKIVHYMLQIQSFSLINPFLIVYDLYYNDFVLTKIFNFLPIYFIYLLWYKTKNLILHVFTSADLYEILYDLYYQQHEVKYLFLTPNYLHIIMRFIRYGLVYNNVEFGCDVSSTSSIMIYECQYILVDKENLIYKNKYSKRKFYIKTVGNKDKYYEIF